jgi:hypothetical protein
LTYAVGRKEGVRVDVVDSQNARPLYSLTTPPAESEAEYRETTIDAAGDVLVAGEPRPVRAPDVSLPQQAWWADSRARTAHTLRARFGASLSDQHIAYISEGEGEAERIAVLDLASGATRIVVAFSDAAQLEGFGLGGNVLAWSQQSYAYQLSGEQPDACFGLALMGDPQLAAVSLSAPGPPVTVSASPGTPPTGRECPATP